MAILRCFPYFASLPMVFYNRPWRDKNYYFHFIGAKTSLEMLVSCFLNKETRATIKEKNLLSFSIVRSVHPMMFSDQSHFLSVSN